MDSVTPFSPLPLKHAPVCPISGIIDLIGKKWTLCAVVSIGSQLAVRFKALAEMLHGISARTLSDTLRALEKEGLVTRRSFAEIPPRVEYGLTPRGRELRDAIQPLMEWASKRGA